ncbi:MAG: HAD family phosphatase [Micrococcales bacterium]|nr:HAD family phosphatase [Micrococcales bacterium]MDN5702879.1 HAD family phosphatase [Micrococcales bacterium]
MSSRTFPQAVLFDHDGTLMDTEPLWDLAKRRLAAEHGGTWSAQDTDDVMGRSIGLTLQRLRERGVDLEDRVIGEQLAIQSRQLLREHDLGFIPGVEALLEEVAAAGIPAAIVTNATTEMAQHTATKGPENMFDVIIGDQELAQGIAAKPSPEGYLEASRRLRVDPAQCIAIEDSPSGVEAAQAAGMTVVVVPGALPVDPQQGTVHLADHRQLSLALLEWLDPQQRSWPKAVLLDHDGTLVDTEPEWAIAKRTVARSFGQEWTEEDDMATLGRTVQESAQLMLDRGAEGELQEVTDRIGAEVAAATAEHVPFLPARPQLLDELAEAAIPAAIVTNALAAVIAGTAAAAPHAIRAAVSREDVEHAKPHPEPYLTAAERLMTAPEDCIAVEDSIAGAQSATAAGMPVVIVPGEREVPTEPGFVPVARHEDVTLELLRSIGPLVPELPRCDMTADLQGDPSEASAGADAADRSRAELERATRRPASQVLRLNRG